MNNREAPMRGARRAEAAEALGVHRDTLLNFERRGVIHPQRDWAGHRRYSAEDLATLRRVISGRHPARENEPAGSLLRP
jgi:predicted site-specific integrase-resolvase